MCLEVDPSYESISQIGTPLYNRQKACSQCVCCSEAPLYMYMYLLVSFGFGTLVVSSVICTMYMYMYMYMCPIVDCTHIHVSVSLLSGQFLKRQPGVFGKRKWSVLSCMHAWFGEWLHHLPSPSLPPLPLLPSLPPSLSLLPSLPSSLPQVSVWQIPPQRSQ